jgi:hypothetical protein
MIIIEIIIIHCYKFIVVNLLYFPEYYYYWDFFDYINLIIIITSLSNFNLNFIIDFKINSDFAINKTVITIKMVFN